MAAFRAVRLTLAGAAALALASVALAQTAAPDTPAHGGHGAAATQEDTPATAAFRDINAQMHPAMDVEYTNDVDIDFVRLMIPHHEGAVSMAAVLLEHSSDPQMRSLAEAVIAAQESEIALMRAYLNMRGVAD